MQRVSFRVLTNLFSATEAVGDDDFLVAGVPHCRQQHSFGTCLRDLVLCRLKTKWTGHAAAARIEHRCFHANALEHLFLGLGFEDRFMMAMRLRNGLALELREFKLAGLLLDEFTEEHRLP